MRTPWWALVVLSGCALYSQDLGRMVEHYDANEYERALSIARVLEEDFSSLSPAEQARYAFVRGMTDFRLSSTTVQGTGTGTVRDAYRRNSRYWLGLASALERQTPGSLRSEEKERLEATLAEVNVDVFGAAKPGGATPKADPKADAKPTAGG